MVNLSDLEKEVEFRYTRASGPGGQNVNKVSSAVQVRWSLANTNLLPADALLRLRKLAGRRITADDVLIIDAHTHRSQQQNRAAALARLHQLLLAATRIPKPRLATQPTPASKERRLQQKKRRGIHKKNRQLSRQQGEEG